MSRHLVTTTEVRENILSVDYGGGPASNLKGGGTSEKSEEAGAASTSMYWETVPASLVWFIVDILIRSLMYDGC